MSETKMITPSMAESHLGKHQTRLLKNHLLDGNNNDYETPSVPHLASDRQSAAVKFKYDSNAARQDIEDLRQLLKCLRQEQRLSLDPDEYNFYGPDFERMIADDWLVTRFLLRGKKMLLKDTTNQSLDRRTLLMDSELDDVECADKVVELDRQAMLEYTIELVKLCARFRFDYRVNSRTQSEEFPAEWVETGGLFNFRPDSRGNPAIYLRVCLHRPKLIATPELRHLFKRYLLYTMERCDLDLYNNPGKAICCVFDMTNATFENIDLELTTWMIKSFKSSSPKLICYVIIYNPPWFFRATFKVLCNTLLSNSKRQSVKFASGNEILDYIHMDNLPPYLRATIQQKDLGCLN